MNESGFSQLPASSRFRFPRLRFPRCESSATDFHPVLTYGLYPLLFGAMVLYAWFELRQPAAQLGSYYGYYTFVLVTSLIVIEAVHPLRAEWRMTASSFFRRDLPYLAIGGITVGCAQFAAAGL